MQFSIELAIDLADLRVLLPFSALLLISAIGIAALLITPWRRLERPAGLEDYHGVTPSKPWPRS